MGHRSRSGRRARWYSVTGPAFDGASGADEPVLESIAAGDARVRGRGRVLVTGGAGFIGSHTCVALIEAGYEPVIVDTHVNSRPDVVARIGALTGTTVEAHLVDVRRADAVAAVLRRGIDAVIHFAAWKSVAESVARPLAYYDLNIGGTVALLQAMAETGVSRLLFSGSCSIFGDADVLPIPEDARLAPTNPYAMTKATCERLLADHCAIQPDLQACSLRYFNPIGAHPSGLLGEESRGVPTNLLPLALQVAVGERDELVVFGDDYDTPDGTCIRDYLHVVDLARAHVLALDPAQTIDLTVAVDRRDAADREPLCGPVGGHFSALNLGTGRGTSVLELIECVRDVTGRPVPTVVAPRRPGDVGTLVADPSLANRRLGWSCARDLHAMVEDAWRFECRRLERQSATDRAS